MTQNTALSHISKEHKHASVKTYLQIALVLAVITIVEVCYPYLTVNVDFLHPYYIPILAVLSLAKFILVVGYYMHLRYDPAILNIIFIFSLIVALSVGLAMMFLYGVVSFG